MARIVVAPFWQQKHPTPTSDRWEFHWHPRNLPRALTDAIAGVDAGLAGAGAAAWVVGDGFAAWVRTFAASAPSEQRGYVGLAGAWCRPTDATSWGELAPAALAALAAALPEAAPHAADLAPREVTVAPVRLLEPPWESPAAAPGFARMLCRGERAVTPAAADARMATLVGALLSWLPPADRLGRRGSLVPAGTAAGGRAEAVEHYLGRLWAEADAGAARRTWQLVVDAAAAAGEPLADFFAGLGRLAEAWDAPAALTRYLREVLGAEATAACDARAPAPLFAGGESDAGELWARVVHYWGRGFLAGDGVLERLAALGARRVLVDHLVALDESRPALATRYLRRMRYEALLPLPAARTLMDAMVRVAPGLEARP